MPVLHTQPQTQQVHSQAHPAPSANASQGEYFPKARSAFSRLRNAANGLSSMLDARLLGQGPDPIQPETAEPETVQPETAEAETAEAETAEAETAERAAPYVSGSPKHYRPKGLKQGAYDIAGFISEHAWGALDASIHLGLSKTVARLYRTRASALFIRPYCWWNYGDANHHRHFKPGDGLAQYTSFQAFFTRDLKAPPALEGKEVWPCEGFVCESGPLENVGPIHVKGEATTIEAVFGGLPADIERSGLHFTNVFLHNNNYHHIHAPVRAKITAIERIPGKLLLLRPWAYRARPSLPALVNERVNIELRDMDDRYWHLSVVGGPLVATVHLPADIQVGAMVNAGEKIASFALGSTCCIVSPVQPRSELGALVLMGQALEGSGTAPRHVQAGTENPNSGQENAGQVFSERKAKASGGCRGGICSVARRHTEC